MHVTGLRDRALATALARGALRGNESDEAHELLRACEAAEVTHLGHDPERGQRVDAAQAAQPAHELTPGALGREGRGPALEPGDARVDEVEGLQVVVEGRLPSWEGKRCCESQLRRVTPHDRVGMLRSLRSRKVPRRCRARMRSMRASSRARSRSRAASSSGEGTTIGSSNPPA